MKKFILLLVLNSVVSLYAQTGKKEILLDENGNTITLEEFKTKISPPDYKYTYYRTQTLPDSIIQNRLVLREDIGKINESDRLEVINILKEITGSPIDPTKTIIIHYFFKDTGHNEAAVVESYISDKKLIRFIRRNQQYTQFFISESGFLYKNEKLYEDKLNKIRDTLFVFPFVSSYIIIRPNGEYYKYIGEYSFDKIRKSLKAE